MPGNGDWSGVQACFCEAGAQGQDTGCGGGRCLAWIAQGPARAGFDRGQSAFAVPAEQFVDLLPAYSIAAGCLGPAQAHGTVTARTMTFCFDISHPATAQVSTMSRLTGQASTVKDVPAHTSTMS